MSPQIKLVSKFITMIRIKLILIYFMKANKVNQTILKSRLIFFVFIK